MSVALSEAYKVLSSAKLQISALFTNRVMSFIKMLVALGGTPIIISYHSLVVYFYMETPRKL